MFAQWSRLECFLFEVEGLEQGGLQVSTNQSAALPPACVCSDQCVGGCKYVTTEEQFDSDI